MGDHRVGAGGGRNALDETALRGMEAQCLAPPGPGRPDPIRTAKRPRPLEEETEDAASETPENTGKNAQSAYVSREQVLRRFLTLWAENRPDEMYAMFFVESRKMLSSENFARETAKAADFRAGLKDGYHIDWVGEERAKVITDRRFLMFRSLVVRTLGVTREGSSWKVVW